MKSDSIKLESVEGGDAVLDVLSYLECPQCADCSWPVDGLRIGVVYCLSCHHGIEVWPGRIRLGTSPNSPDGLSQRLMHARPVVAVYESAWRPAITWAASGVSYSEEMAFLRKHLSDSPSSQFIDWCCGTGLHGRILAEHLRKPGLVVGVDASAPMARTAAARAVGSRQVILEADIYEVRSRKLFTGGYCFAALHLLQDQQQALTHMAGALHPGAPFLCFTLYRPGGDPIGRLGRLLGIRTKTRESVAAMFGAAGLEIQEVKESGRALMLQSRRA